MNARNRVFVILGLLTLGSLIWYLVTARTSGDLKLIGTVDANEVLVSAKIPGRIQTLNVEEGQAVKAGDLIAVVESEDLAAAQKAALANVQSDQSKLAETVETQRQNAGEVSSATVNAQAQVKATQAALAQAEANLAHQQADTTRTVALAKQGIASAQARDEAETALNAAEAAVQSAHANVAAAQAAVQQAKAHELLAQVSAKTVASTRGVVQNAKALADQASVQLGLCEGVCARCGAGECIGGAARRGAAGGRDDCDHHGFVADMGVCAIAGDAGGCGETRRRAEGCDAERRTACRVR